MASTETVEPFGVPGSSAGGRDIQAFVEIGSQLEVAGSITASHAGKALETTIDVLLQELKARGTFVLAWQLLGVLVWATTHHLWVDIISGLMNPLEGEGDDAWVGASCWSSLYAGRKREEN